MPGLQLSTAGLPALPAAPGDCGDALTTTVEYKRFERCTHQPAGESVGLEGLCMPREEHIILRSVGSDVAKELE